MMTRKILFLLENEVGTEKNEKGKLIRGVVKFAHLIGQCQSIANLLLLFVRIENIESEGAEIPGYSCTNDDYHRSCVLCLLLRQLETIRTMS